MTTCNNVFVLFAPGTGGNHIANLISTSDLYVTRATIREYQTHNQNNAHVSEYKNLDLENIKNLEKPERLVLCGHWGEYCWLMINNQLEKFQNKKIVIVSVPTPGTLAYERYTKSVPKDLYSIEEQRTLYTPAVIEKMFDETDWFVFDPNWIFSDNLENFFKFAKSEMALPLDQSVCQDMHNIWFQNIKNLLKI